MTRRPQVSRGGANVLLRVKVRTQRENYGTLDPRTNGIPQKVPCCQSKATSAGVGEGLRM